jgi:hypothetical protein
MARRPDRRGRRSRVLALAALLAGGWLLRRRRSRQTDGAAAPPAPQAAPPTPPLSPAPDPGGRSEPVVTLWEQTPEASRSRVALRVLCEQEELTAAVLAPLLTAGDGDPADARRASHALGALRRAEGELLVQGSIDRRVLECERDRRGASHYRLRDEDRAALRRHLGVDG